jgi:mono/diheme cytochrome c family protein
MLSRLLIVSMLAGGLISVHAADVAAGKTSYDAACKKCHGADGAPNAAIAKMLKVEMKHLGSKEVQAKSDAQLKKETVGGVGKMKAMPAAEKDADNIVAFLRTLKQ